MTAQLGGFLRKEIDQMLTLTVAEIKDLAECAGLVLDKSVSYDDDELETGIVVMECPKAGVRDDDGKPTHYAHIAYFDEYPEEGSYPLGAELAPPNGMVSGLPRKGETE